MRGAKMAPMTATYLQRVFVRFLLLAALCAPLSNVGADTVRFVAIGTAGPDGIYFLLGNAVCELVHQQGGQDAHGQRQERIQCVAPATGGSRFNVRQLSIGAMEFGLVQSDWHYHAYHGTAPDKVVPVASLRSVLSVHREPFLLMTRADSGIERFEDLRDKRVNVGNPGSGQRGTMEVLLNAYGMTLADIDEATELTSTEDGSALCNDEIDAFVSTLGFPHPKLTAVIEDCGARILNLDTDVETQLVKEFPYYSFVTLPKDVYQLSSSTTTLGVVATLVTRVETDEQTVYAIVRAVMENLSALGDKHAALKSLSPGLMIEDGLFAPLHPGAIRYYKEKGWM